VPGIHFKSRLGAKSGEHTAAEKPEVLVSLCRRLRGEEELEQLCREHSTSFTSEARRGDVSKRNSLDIDAASHRPAPSAPSC